MMREVMDEARQILHEMPAFAAVFLLAVAMCVGVRCAIFLEADGEQLRLIADAASENTPDANDPIGRMRALGECSARVPGFTGIVGLRQYNMELSVPVTSVRALFKNARMNSARAFRLQVHRTA